ncbi:DUF4073 domain-containing protein [Ureibacillus thermosphaericus]|uniref:SLH domain-containing protein n=1 Tax=Ureibacillus thermosphaericus TaxID=51173 RepID=A0A840PRH3_URETH|nr:DUF4073 domain-containing protein [Ureibacillus thermosphaericus]MBB5147744.1 hypothetical protein [Ureibacillus thermosphaericus]NKZ30454.1 DUF4073 domain-containing protein [Ureibacillus thermosphaericus]
MNVKRSIRRLFQITLVIVMILLLTAPQTFAFTQYNTAAYGLAYRNGDVYFTGYDSAIKISKISSDGNMTDVATNFQGLGPISLDFDSDGNLYYTIPNSFQLGKIYKISSADLAEVTVNAANVATEVVIGGGDLFGLAFHPITGDVYFSDNYSKKIYRILKNDFNEFPIELTDEKVHEIGTMMNLLFDIAFDSAGNLYISDFNGIIKVSNDDLADGHIDNALSYTPLTYVFGITFTSDNRLYYSTLSPAVIKLLDDPPIANDVLITGQAEVGKTLSGSYIYSDTEGALEGETTFKWYRADNASGDNKTAISGATGNSYNLTEADVGKYISFAVTPVAQSGWTHGLEVLSSFIGPVIVTAPSAPNVTVDDVNNIIIGIDETMEYKIDEGDWTPYNEQTPPNLSGNKTVKVRVKATNDTPAGEETQLVFTANPPGAPNVTANDTNNIIIGINETMEYKIDEGDWTPYNEQTPPNLSGNKTVKVRVKATNDTPAGEETLLVFTANPSPSKPDRTPSTSQSTTEQIIVDVDGNNDFHLTKISVIRSKEQDGTIKDEILMTDSNAKETVLKAKEQGIDTVRIIIPDEDDQVAEVKVEITKTALEELNNGNLKLEIATSNAVISIPVTSIHHFNQDLYFRIVPMKSATEQNQVEERAKNEPLIKEAVGDNAVQVIGRPMEIETNMQSRQVSIILPITANLPTNPAERQKVLNNLGVYIEHSDGSKELMKGTVVKMKDGSEGLEFEVNKFSTFSIVYLEGWQDEVAEEETETPEKAAHIPYINGYNNNEFRPNAFVTRAQMAKMIAQNLDGSLSTKAFEDVKSSHWAFNYVLEVKEAGIMTGVNQTTFNLNGNVTRAQMASIVYRWIQKQCEKDSSAYASCGMLSDIPEASFKDVMSDHWAAEAINFTKVAGIMVGFEDQTFKPNQELTRAQALKVINMLFKRGPLTNVETPTFLDVPKTHWAFGEVEEAVREHDILLDDNR